MDAINLANIKSVDAICTLPINKESWGKAKLKYKGHTEVLRDFYNKEAIMMLGCQPIYCINRQMLEQASMLLEVPIPNDFMLHETFGDFEILPSKTTKESGIFSYLSFMDAINLANIKSVDAICTLPIKKESWGKAKLKYKGHTEVLRDFYKKEAIMMLGCLS